METLLPAYGIPLASIPFSRITAEAVASGDYIAGGVLMRELAVPAHGQFERAVTKLLLQSLKERSIYNPSLLYRCFDPGRLEYVVLKGTDRSSDSHKWEESQFPEADKLHLSTEDMLIHILGTQGPRRYQNKTCVSVYNADQFQPLDLNRGLYLFKNPDGKRTALVHIFNLLIHGHFEEAFNLFDD
ncbi:hypothetical protein HYV81_05390 [Candidatus Woesearchaeota archaeon]|nr:hypothetical protein [Candidatus Woesearchaeota archaeon]